MNLSGCDYKGCTYFCGATSFRSKLISKSSSEKFGGKNFQLNLAAVHCQSDFDRESPLGKSEKFSFHEDELFLFFNLVLLGKFMKRRIIGS